MASSSAAAMEITESWNAETVLLSYIIAVTGSFCTIQIMEQWRMQESVTQKRKLLLFASIALGGCGIWAMHFTGMQAQHATLADGSEVRVDFELGTTIVSLLFPIAGVFIGLTIASRDPFFLEIEHERRKAIVADQIRTMSITEILKKGAVQRRIKFIALFSRLWYILLGGLWAALGVLGMHYLGMMAQRSTLSMRFDVGIVAASCVIAFVTATAAFWIIFRALTFWPSIDALRVGSALIMGVAVCGTHYTGMAAAQLSVGPSSHSDDRDSGFVVDGEAAFRVASNGSLVLCFWLVSLTVVRDLRVTAASARGASQTNNTNGHHSSHGAGNSADQTSVLPFRNPTSNLPRNAVQPMFTSSTGPAPHTASGPLTKNTAVARLLNKQNVVAGPDRDAPVGGGDLEQAWKVVPGSV